LNIAATGINAEILIWPFLWNSLMHALSYEQGMKSELHFERRLAVFDYKFLW
jgi:hypothetical protein